MKRILIYLTAGLLVAGSSSLLADGTNTTSQTDGQTTAQKLRDMTPAERKAYIADHPELARKMQERKAVMERMGIDHKELRGLSPEDRRAKVTEAAENTVKELEAKKASGTLTAQDQTDLTYIQNNILAHKHHKPAGTN